MTAGRTRERWGLIAVIVAGTMVGQGFGRFTYALVLPAVQEDLAISYTLAGGLGTANLAAYLIGTALVSVVARRVALDGIMRVGIVGSAIGLGAMWWSPNLVVLAGAMVLTGLSGAMVWIPSPGVAASLVAAERRGLAIGLIGTGIGIGFVSAGWASRALVQRGWQAIYGAEAALAVMTAVAMLTLLHTGTTDRSDRRPSFDVLRGVPGWRRLLVAYASYGLSMAFFVNFLVARLEEDAGFDAGSSAAVFSVFGIATIFGGPIFGPLSDRIGRGSAMTLGFGGMATAALLALVSAQPWPSVAAAIFGLAFAGVPTALAAQLSDHLATQAFGAAFGTITLAFGAAQVVGPQLGGFIGDQTGSFTLVFVASAALATVGVAASRRVPPRALGGPAAGP